MSDITVRRATIEEQLEVEALAKAGGHHTKDFKYLWRLFHGWEDSPPFVALIDGKIVGFHAAKFLKKTYVNSYYICVSDTHKRKGVSSKLLEVVLAEAQARGLTRFTTKTATSGEGYPYYLGFGLNPFCVSKQLSVSDTEYVFDFNIQGITTTAQLRASAATPLMPDEKRLVQYRKKYGYQG